MIIPATEPVKPHQNYIFYFILLILNPLKNKSKSPSFQVWMFSLKQQKVLFLCCLFNSSLQSRGSLGEVSFVVHTGLGRVYRWFRDVVISPQPVQGTGWDFAWTGWEEDWLKLPSCRNLIVCLSIRKDTFTGYVGGRVRTALLPSLTDSPL